MSSHATASKAFLQKMQRSSTATPLDFRQVATASPTSFARPGTSIQGLRQHWHANKKTQRQHVRGGHLLKSHAFLTRRFMKVRKVVMKVRKGSSYWRFWLVVTCHRTHRTRRSRRTKKACLASTKLSRGSLTGSASASEKNKTKD